MSINSNLRLGGMASGFDTESMIKNLMQIEKMKVDRVIQQRTRMEWTQGLRADIHSRVTDFRHSVMSVLSSNNLNTANAFKGNKVTGISQGSGVDITAGASAFRGHYSVKVNQMATGAVLTSNDLSGLDMDGSLEQLGMVFEEDAVSFKINDKTFSFNRESTVRQMVSQINSGQAGVQMRFSELTGKITMTTAETGEEAQLDIESLAGQAFGAPWTNTSGLNAEVVINDITVQRGTNTFTIDNINYRLTAATDETHTFQVEHNIDQTVDRVRHFVEEYNSLLSFMQEKVSEPVLREFLPLTDTQRAEMSDRDIEMWEEKAMSGLLRNDRALGSLISQMRTGLFSNVAGTGMNLTSIGITTSSYQEQGKLHLDEDKLRRTLAEEPDNVMKLFTQTSSADDAGERNAQAGLLQRLRESLTHFSDQNYKPLRYAEDMVRISNQINRMNELLQNKEDSYWRQFAAMEQALSSMYSQSNSLMASLGF